MKSRMVERADVVQPGGAQYRENAPLAHGLPQPIDDVLHRQSALGKELFQQRIVAFGDHLHQRFMRGLGGIGKIGGNFALFALAVAIGREVNRLHADEIHHALKLLLGADGDCTGTAARPKTLCTLSKVRWKSARSRSSRLITMARGRLNWLAKLQTFSVCTSTPATPSTSTSAASAAASEARVSLMKML